MKIPAVTLAIGDSDGVDIRCEEGVVDVEADKVDDIMKFGRIWLKLCDRNCEIWLKL